MYIEFIIFFLNVMSITCTLKVENNNVKPMQMLGIFVVYVLVGQFLLFYNEINTDLHICNANTI